MIFTKGTGIGSLYYSSIRKVYKEYNTTYKNANLKDKKQLMNILVLVLIGIIFLVPILLYDNTVENIWSIIAMIIFLNFPIIVFWGIYKNIGDSNSGGILNDILSKSSGISTGYNLKTEDSQDFLKEAKNSNVLIGSYTPKYLHTFFNKKFYIETIIINQLTVVKNGVRMWDDCLLSRSIFNLEELDLNYTIQSNSIISLWGLVKRLITSFGWAIGGVFVYYEFFIMNCRVVVGHMICAEGTNHLGFFNDSYYKYILFLGIFIFLFFYLRDLFFINRQSITGYSNKLDILKQGTEKPVITKGVLNEIKIFLEKKSFIEKPKYSFHFQNKSLFIKYNRKDIVILGDLFQILISGFLSGISNKYFEYYNTKRYVEYVNFINETKAMSESISLEYVKN